MATVIELFGYGPIADIPVEEERDKKCRLHFEDAFLAWAKVGHLKRNSKILPFPFCLIFKSARGCSYGDFSRRPYVP